MINLPQTYLTKTAFSFVVLAVAYFLSLLIKKSINFTFHKVKGRVNHEALIAKTRTIRYVVNNAITVIFFLIAFLIVLSQWGVNIAPILASAGIVGLAFSFGAQSLVKDFIAGFFIIFENQFNIGDRIKVTKDVEGVVSDITLRITVLKDKDGNLIYIPNSQLAIITRFNSKPKISSIRSR